MKVAAFHAGRALADDDLEPSLVACTWCGADELTPFHTIQVDPPVVLRRCRRCRACGVSRLPTADALDRYYAGYYEGSRAPAVTMDDPTRLARRIASYVRTRDHLTVLDLGGGDGTIAALVLARRAAKGAITVVDYDHRRRVAVPAGVELEQLTDLDDVAAGRRFDLVLASAVLEHLPRPAGVLTDLLERVAPGGAFYARTPYVEPFLGLADRLRLPVDFTFPAHLYDLGPRFWAGLAGWAPAAHRFTVVASRPSPVETGLRRHPLRTAMAATAKAPWHVTDRWPFVGGWEHVLMASPCSR